MPREDTEGMARMAHISYRISGNHAGKPVSRRFPDTKEGRSAASRFA